ncbi:PadR family transcriptional regulator [Neorhizobium alkalisoli]|uniref:PadR family transcriptional regulator n=1 Tax=Neorhizobium alkalisoli TaxID=528178 RepID=A0A561QP56_9HYPH|nr:PadR family transcriptional regulator [Neorhizobium alkalisoli]TWF52137.1 PadR family transcriptional regulator [Neorhizobium alkalisoli]
MADSIQIQLRKGVLDLCVLAVLSRGESYGYEIASTLVSAVGMGEGTIYPLMRRMQTDGLVATRIVESSSGPPRKYYRLTELGQTVFETHRSDWRAFTVAVDTLLEDLS